MKKIDELKTLKYIDLFFKFNHYLYLQKEYEKMKSIKDDQEKLLISAWYSVVKYL